MSYTEREMDQSPETPKIEQGVTWEVIKPEELPPLLDHTIEETVFQSAARADTGTALLAMIPPQDTGKREKALEMLGKATTATVHQLRQLQAVLKQDPSKPVPIDHRYGSKYLIIALDLIEDSSNPQNPTSEHK